MELTPEEHQKIYLEEKARFEVRRHLEAEKPLRTSAQSVIVQQRPSNGIAAVLSLFFPGAGQIYKGSVGAGLAWLIVTVLGYFLFIIPGLVLHLICILHAASMRPSGFER